MAEKFNETDSVEQVKEYLLNAIRGEGVIHTKPAEDSLNYAAAYKAICDAERIRKENVGK